MLLNVFISCCCLDYCNSLLYGINDGLLRRHIQSVQDTAARLVTGTRQCDHVTPLPQQLHRLPVHHRQLSDVICWPLHSGSNDIQMLSVPRTTIDSETEASRPPLPIVEQSTTWTATARLDICSFQAETENALAWTWLQLRLRHIVTFYISCTLQILYVCITA